MALRRQSLSPTANLLRNSRLFSLPNPLPRPLVGETYGSGMTKASDTATLPYPTHQAIATTKSSLARGDWGLKRPLPARSRILQTSDPVLRITQLDTIEHVTDFESAADHVRTRQKWEEMGVPMMKGMSQMRDYDLSGAPPSGAFEIRDDTTSYDNDLGLDEAGLYLKALEKSSGQNYAQSKKARVAAKTDRTAQPAAFTPFTPPSVDAAVHNTRRWKHDGPWLPGISAAEFTQYLNTEISKRRRVFNIHLNEFVKNEIYATRRLAASKSGSTAPMDLAEAEKWHAEQEKQWSNISSEDISAGFKALRKETATNPLGSKLVRKLILPFLRLPTIRFKYKAYAEDASNRDIEQYQFDQETAPLSTHPSAGLGYLRTRSYIANHPILGPQSSPSPVASRVVQPRTTGGGKEVYARLGVGGFVANDQFRSTDTSSASRANISNSRDVETIDLETPGGKKVLVQAMFGSVSNDGRIHIKLKRSTGPEIQVARGELDDKPPVRENFDSDPLKGLGGMGRSGVEELDALSRAGRNGATELGEQSARAQQLTSFLDAMKTPDKNSSPEVYPGEALRPGEATRQ
ncbi:hypothetical protein P153DRAFT_300951 [Dothidotthia symphoricarpi CBS 119687]|uniref:Uncharacterized protein n=1 Tax=Dothidotthia symphoricarpi CBS 119687 TaxID=1392245 RepID=A0A6A6A1W8_9PLEO|nr:uncharacterized protein P153DRAFT_300951 [Dothidotthia symphoricarpi CBS 119687]KAF2125195.1 hypothetical protein P153DRAFT_300951 [Dothidotthia symphoricarpi CBS 119687]